jgi:hypothetical protein
MQLDYESEHHQANTITNVKDESCDEVQGEAVSNAV